MCVLHQQEHSSRPPQLCSPLAGQFGSRVFRCRCLQALDALEKLQANLKQEQVLQSELSMEVFERVSLRLGILRLGFLRTRFIPVCWHTL